MITKEYAMAYKEVIEILKYVPDKDVAKIPLEKLVFYKENMDKDYDYKIDESKEFEEQKISEITKAVLANIFRDYWATPHQKENIIAKEKLDLENLEKEKRKKYNPNDLFKNRNKNDNIEILEQPKQNAQIIEYQEPKWYQKIFAKLLNIFRKK